MVFFYCTIWNLQIIIRSHNPGVAFAEDLILEQQMVLGKLLWRMQWSRGASQMMNSLSCCLKQVDSLLSSMSHYTVVS
jgi:hypothetical protein